MSTNTDECPSCGRKTLSERGITITYNKEITAGGTWLACVNCDWDSKEGSWE